MTLPTVYSFTRYLAAKKSVDDRALNRHVWQSLQHHLPDATPETPLRVLEVGAGIGTMIERMLEWDLLAHATYTAIDTQAENIDEIRHRLAQWAISHRFALADEGPHRFRLHRSGQSITVIPETIDLFDFIAREQHRHTWDLLVAHAFIDLVDVPTTLPHLLSLLKPESLFYFTLVFDGGTILQPEIDPSYDAYIERLYHETMDQRLRNNQPSGDSQTGRHLFDYIRAAGAMLLTAGSSDWVVFPHAAGYPAAGYPADEAYFLHFIIHTIHTALAHHPDLIPHQFADWINQRHAQIESGELIYIAHQLDFVGRAGA